MARGYLYELSTSKDTVCSMSEYDFYDQCNSIAEYFSNADRETCVNTLTDELKQYGIQIVSECDEDEEESYPYFTLTEETKQNYFRSRFETFKKAASEMTLAKFTKNMYTFLSNIEDDYSDGVYLNNSFYSFDYFIRDAIVGTKYYIGNVVLMH